MTMKKIIVAALAAMAMITSANATETTNRNVTGLYIAKYDRAILQHELDNWVKPGVVLEDISKSFFDPGSLPTETFVRNVYDNIFNRSPNLAESSYWTDRINDGLLLRSKFVLSVINDAQGIDREVLDNRISVSIDFAVSGLNDLLQRDIILNDVTDAVITVMDANDQIQVWKEENPTPTPTPEPTYTQKDLDLAKEEGRQECINDPESCGIVSVCPTIDPEPAPDPGSVINITMEPTIIKKARKRVTIKWETDLKANSVIHYGIDDLEMVANKDKFQKTHIVRLRSLSSKTTYQFMVESTTSDGDLVQSEIHYFTTD